MVLRSKEIYIKRRIVLSVCICSVLFAVSYIDVYSYSKRMILIEEFTNTLSNESGEANAFFTPYTLDNTDDMITIVYHSNQPSNKDPFNRIHAGLAEERANYYKNHFDYFDVPNAFINGNFWYGSPYNVRKIDNKIKEINTKYSPIDFNFDMSIADSTYTMTLNISSSENIGKKKLFFYLMDYTYSRWQLPANSVTNGEDYFYWIPRKSLTGESGIDINLEYQSDTSLTYQYKFDNSYKYGNSYLVAFIQDETTGEILQAGTNFKKFPCDISIKDDKYMKIDRYTPYIIDVSFENPTEYDITYNLSTYCSNLNCNIVLDTSKVNIKAGEKIDMGLEIYAKSNFIFEEIEIIAIPQLFMTKDYMGVKGNISEKIYCLVNSADMITLTYGDLAIKKLKQIQSNLEYYNNRWAVMSIDIFNAEYSDFDFDFYYFDIPAGFEEKWGTDSTLEELTVIALQKEKPVLISAPKGLSVRNNSVDDIEPTPILERFYDQILEIELAAMIPGIKYDDDERDFSVVENAALGSYNEKRIPFVTLNNEENLYYEYWETIEIIGDYSTPITFYCDDPLDIDGPISGIYYQEKESKCIYLTYSLATSNSTDSASAHLKTLLELLDYYIPTTKLELSSYEVILMAKADSLVSKSVEIINSGDTDIRIDSMNLLTMTDSIYDFSPKLTNEIIRSGKRQELTITFKPDSLKYYEAKCNIFCNGEETPFRYVSIYGYGTNLNVFDDVNNIIEVFPNPIKSISNLHIEINVGIDIKCDLYTSDARKVKTIFSGFIPKGKSNIPLNIEGLSQGNYFIIIKDKANNIKNIHIIIK